MAPPRRKSCIACIKAKRRCDLGIPVCGRCSIRNLQCTYGTSNPQTSKRTQPTETVSSNPGNTAFAIESNQGGQLSAQTSVNHEIAAPPPINTPLPSFLDENFDWSVIDDYIVPDQLHSLEDDEPEIVTGHVFQARVVFGMKQLKSWPGKFAKHCHTCFINSNLWSDEQTPKILLDALSTCNLYQNKTTHNEDWVFLHLRNMARAVVSHAGHQGNWTSPMDHLAGVQVLLLYQIIRLFDGDIRQRAEAENIDNILEIWTDQLKDRLDQASSSKEALTEVSTPITGTWSTGDSNSAIISNDWHNWMFNESLRRTILVSYLLRGTYTFIKLGWDGMGRQVRSCTYTAQARLWNAKSELQWQQARKELQPFEVTVRFWDNEMDTARPIDLDDLGVVLYAFIKGMDGLRDWLGSNGLETFGLA